MLDQYSRVRLVSDKFQAEGAIQGAIGYIIETYNNGDYEVEFSDTQGITIAQIVARDSDLERQEE